LGLAQAEQSAELTVRLRAARAEAVDAVAAAAAGHCELREARRVAAAATSTTTEPTATESALVKQVRALCVRGCVGAWGGQGRGVPQLTLMKTRT
jgi:hypothetical protein